MSTGKNIKLSYFLAIVSILLIIFGCFAPLIFSKCGSIANFTNTGQIGDTIGGTMSPIVAIAGVIMTFIAFLMQVDANKIQSEQLKKSFNFKLLENQLGSRNALELLSLDIKVMIRDIDATCDEIDMFCTSSEANPTGVVPFHFTPKQSHSRYISINRNAVYNAYSSFLDSEHYLDYFRKTYTLLDFYSEGMDILYSNIYKRFTDDIMAYKYQIPSAFEDLCNKFNEVLSKEDETSRAITFMFNKHIHEKLIKNGILDILELHKTLKDERFAFLFVACNMQCQRILGLINSVITQSNMLITEMRNTKTQFQASGRYNLLVELQNKIDNALQIYTVEYIQNNFEASLTQ